MPGEPAGVSNEDSSSSDNEEQPQANGHPRHGPQGLADPSQPASSVLDSDGVRFYQRFARDFTAAERDRLVLCGVVLHEHRRYTPQEDSRIWRNWARFARLNALPREAASTYVCHGTSLAAPDQRTEAARLARDKLLVAALCRKLPHRTGASVYRRARKLFDETHGTSPFSAEDDRRLLELHRRHGENWLKIGRLLGHSLVECRWRFDKLTGAARAMTGEEQTRLKRVVADVAGVDWSTGTDRPETSTGSTKPETPSTNADWSAQVCTTDLDWTAVQRRLGRGAKTAAGCRKQWLTIKRAAFGADKRLTKAQEHVLMKRIKRQRPTGGQSQVDWTAVCVEPISPLYADPAVVKLWFQQLKYRRHLRDLWYDLDRSFWSKLKRTYKHLKRCAAASELRVEANLAGDFDRRLEGEEKGIRQPRQPTDKPPTSAEFVEDDDSN